MAANTETTYVYGATANEDSTFALEVTVTDSTGTAIDWTTYSSFEAGISDRLGDAVYIDTAAATSGYTNTLTFTGDANGVLHIDMSETDVNYAINTDGKTRFVIVGVVTKSSVVSRVLEVHGSYRKGHST